MALAPVLLSPLLLYRATRCQVLLLLSLPLLLLLLSSAVMLQCSISGMQLSAAVRRGGVVSLGLVVPESCRPWQGLNPQGRQS